MRRLTVLISGFGSNLQAILDACVSGALPGAQVVRVLSSDAAAYGLERARAAQLPVGVAAMDAATRRDPAARAAWDAALAARVALDRPDLLVLAGWRLILSAAFLDAAPCPVLNLHPALPGAFPGLRAIERAWEEGRAGRLHQSGVMVHRVTPALDDGPLVAVEALPLDPGEPLEAFAARVHAAERRVLVQALRAELALLG